MTDRPLPIVVRLGKQSKKRLQALERNEGKLVGEVKEALERVRESLGEEGEDKVLVPIVIVYKRKEKNRGRLQLPFL